MDDRRTSIQNTGMDDSQFAGLQLLKLLSYRTADTQPLHLGQRLGDGDFIANYAARQAQEIDTWSFGFAVEGVFSVPDAYRQSAATLNDWQFWSHQDLGDGLTALTVRDPSGEFWVFFDGVDRSSPTQGEQGADLAEAGLIYAPTGNPNVLLHGFNPAQSKQFERARTHIDTLRLEGVPNGKLNIVGQSLGGAIVKGLVLTDVTPANSSIWS